MCTLIILPRETNCTNPFGRFFANQALLLETARKNQGFTSRTIRTALGENIQVPASSLGGIIVVSILMLIELLGLVYLTWYIYRVPTWTAMLDSLAVARIANSLSKDQIPAIGSMSEKEFENLGRIDGLVGVVESKEGAGSDSTNEVMLGLGAPGVFNRHLAKFRMKRGSMKRVITMPVDMDCQCEGCQRRRNELNCNSASTL